MGKDTDNQQKRFQLTMLCGQPGSADLLPAPLRCVYKYEAGLLEDPATKSKPLNTLFSLSFMPQISASKPSQNGAYLVS